MAKANQMLTKSRMSWAVSAVLVGALGTVAQAGGGNPIPVENFSFETPSINGGHYNGWEAFAGGNPAGWVWTGGNADGPFIDNPSDGQYSNTSGNGGMNTDGLLPGTADGFQYAAKGVQDSGSGIPQKATLTYTPDAGWELGTFFAGNTYTLTVACGQQTRYNYSQNIYTAVLTGDGTEMSTPSSFTMTAYDTFQDLSFTYVATAADAGKAIGIKLTGAGIWNQAAFDNIRLSVAASEPGWFKDGDGRWSVSGNWMGSVPNAVDAVASFKKAQSTDTLVNVDSAVTVGTLNFDLAGHSYMLSGTGSLTLQASSNPAQINVASGNHVIATRGTTLASNTDINIAAASSLAIQSPLTVANNVTVKKLGDGTLNVEAYQTYGSSDALNVQAGTVNFKVPANGLSVKSTGGTVNFAASQNNLAALNVSAGSAVVTSGTLSTGSLSIGSSGKLDVGANKVIVRGGNVANIEAQLAAGRNVAAGGIGDGSWDGTHGIVSSAAAAAFSGDGIETKAVGLGVSGQMPMGDPMVPGTSTPVFAGTAEGDVMLRCTYNGDATLDGVVDDFDVIVVGALYDAGTTGGHHWYEGDFNGDGKIDDSDVILLGAFYAPTAPVLSDSSLTQTYGAEFAKAFEAGRALAVPEPATLSLLGVASLGLLSRRRHSSK